jgi:hypothetical protein
MQNVNLDAIDDTEIRDTVRAYVSDLTPRGTIGTPGKFEGEPLWTVYFYQHILNGDGDNSYELCEHLQTDASSDCDCDLDISYTSFQVDATDCEVFPALDPYHGREVRVREDSAGFVYSWIPESTD